MTSLSQKNSGSEEEEAIFKFFEEQLDKKFFSLSKPFESVNKLYQDIWKTNLRLEKENKAFEKALVIAKHENSLIIKSDQHSQEIEILKAKNRELEIKLKELNLNSFEKADKIIQEKDELIHLLQEQLSELKKMVLTSWINN